MVIGTLRYIVYSCIHPTNVRLMTYVEHFIGAVRSENLNANIAMCMTKRLYEPILILERTALGVKDSIVLNRVEVP